jgi:hypothetical protein
MAARGTRSGRLSWLLLSCVASLTVGCGGGGGPPEQTGGTGGGFEGDALGSDGRGAVDAVEDDAGADGAGPEVAPPADAAIFGDGAGAANTPLVENRSVYGQDDLTVLRVEVTATDTEALKAVDANVTGATVKVLFREASFGSLASGTNATMALRGHSTRLTFQKSYTIKLDDENTLWRGQKVVDLNKHPYDLTRVRNKLSFDLLKTIPDMTSLRNQFVNLFVNGKDMGLFEQTEHLNKRSLTAHGLDPEGHVYKAENFEFLPLQPQQLADKNKLALVLEQKAGPADHSKLQAVLYLINDNSVSIDTIVARHFDRDNYLTWLAVNILFDNVDTINQNFMLYSPRGSARWYFLPWDYDGAWGFVGQPDQVALRTRPRFHHGLARYWSIPLHRRFLREPANVAALTARMDRIVEQLATAQAIDGKLQAYHPIVRRFVSMSPDVWQLPTASLNNGQDALLARFEAEYAKLSTLPGRMLEDYKISLDWPLPVFMGAISPGPATTIGWDPSFDLQGDALVYDLDVSKTAAFAAADIVVERHGLAVTSASIGQLPAGAYFARVTIREAANASHWQSGFGYYWDDTARRIVYGITPFTVR